MLYLELAQEIIFHIIKLSNKKLINIINNAVKLKHTTQKKSYMPFLFKYILFQKIIKIYKLYAYMIRKNNNLHFF